MRCKLPARNYYFLAMRQSTTPEPEVDGCRQSEVDSYTSTTPDVLRALAFCPKRFSVRLRLLRYVLAHQV